MRPENLGDKIVGWFRGNDIDFDTHPEFSKRFLLNGEDETAVRNLFTPQVMEYFEAKKTLSAEAIGQTLLIYRQGKVPPAANRRAARRRTEVLWRCLNRARLRHITSRFGLGVSKLRTSWGLKYVASIHSHRVRIPPNVESGILTWNTL